MNMKLDKEEQNLYKSLEKNEWRSVSNLNDYKNHLQKIAKNTLHKSKRINLRLTPKDVEEARIKSLKEGIPYQTLLASVIHKYLMGELIDRRKKAG